MDDGYRSTCFNTLGVCSPPSFARCHNPSSVHWFKTIPIDYGTSRHLVSSCADTRVRILDANCARRDYVSSTRYPIPAYVACSDCRPRKDLKTTASRCCSLFGRQPLYGGSDASALHKRTLHSAPRVLARRLLWPSIKSGLGP